MPASTPTPTNGKQNGANAARPSALLKVAGPIPSADVGRSLDDFIASATETPLDGDGWSLGDEARRKDAERARVEAEGLAERARVEAEDAARRAIENNKLQSKAELARLEAKLAEAEARAAAAEMKAGQTLPPLPRASAPLATVQVPAMPTPSARPAPAAIATPQWEDLDFADGSKAVLVPATRSGSRIGLIAVLVFGAIGGGAFGAYKALSGKSTPASAPAAVAAPETATAPTPVATPIPAPAAAPEPAAPVEAAPAAPVEAATAQPAAVEAPSEPTVVPLEDEPAAEVEAKPAAKAKAVAKAKPAAAKAKPAAAKAKSAAKKPKAKAAKGGIVDPFAM